MLALLLVVGAFCWPYSPGTDAPSIRESRVYVLDNTLSHQANDGFGQDRERVLGGIAQAGGDVQVAVVELAGTPRVVVSFSDDRQTAQRKVRELRPSFQRGSYLAAFRQANGLLANSLGQEKRIVFLGDNQANQWNENVHTPPFLGGVQVELPKPAAGRLPNLSLSDARAQRTLSGGQIAGQLDDQAHPHRRGEDRQLRPPRQWPGPFQSRGGPARAAGEHPASGAVGN